jgi:hypothetical protein
LENLLEFPGVVGIFQEFQENGKKKIRRYTLLKYQIAV